MQGMIVSFIVAAAAVYAVWHLMPQNMRRWLIGRLLVVAPSCRAWLTRLEAKTDDDGCNSCRGCEVGEKSPVSRGQAKITVYPQKRDKVSAR